MTSLAEQISKTLKDLVGLRKSNGEYPISPRFVTYDSDYYLIYNALIILIGAFLVACFLYKYNQDKKPQIDNKKKKRKTVTFVENDVFY